MHMTAGNSLQRSDHKLLGLQLTRFIAGQEVRQHAVAKLMWGPVPRHLPSVPVSWHCAPPIWRHTMPTSPTAVPAMLTQLLRINLRGNPPVPPMQPHRECATVLPRVAMYWNNGLHVPEQTCSSFTLVPEAM